MNPSIGPADLPIVGMGRTTHMALRTSGPAVRAPVVNGPVVNGWSRDGGR